MNKAKLKTYAPQARKDFIAAVTQRANLLGLSESPGKFEALPAERRGDVVLIAGREWPARVAPQRERLVRRIQRDGFGYTMEAVAYTWFNRFAALRFMELHDYLGHGHRVLSSATAGGLPDILAQAADLAASKELPGLNAEYIADLKLAGNKDGELYRLLLVAQCNALSAAMPFLFERIDDETELLLPDNLLRTDSVIAKLVAEIPEEDWAQVEIIGWLYRFYISEKKDQVIGKVVKSEDIPAATQLFTPNWIVQYLVQNSVGRLWLMANPASTLKSQWPYYIEPAEQTPEVNAQPDALIQARMDEDGGSLNPESITVLDPACGSGHILVEAYEVLKGIYLERGYRLRDIPRLIREKNLYGLDVDDRAAQLAGFALLMKARADDRRLLSDPPVHPFSRHLEPAQEHAAGRDTLLARGAIGNEQCDAAYEQHRPLKEAAHRSQYGRSGDAARTISSRAAISPTNSLFAGSLRDGRAAAVALSLIETARLNRIEPHGCLTDALVRIVRFVDWKAPGAALQLRSGTVVAMKDTQITVQDDATRATWTLPYAAIEIPAGSRPSPQAASPKAPPRPTRDDFRVGDRVSFEDRHLQTRIGTIVRINQKTASVDCDDQGWRVSFGMLRHVVDL